MKKIAIALLSLLLAAPVFAEGDAVILSKYSSPVQLNKNWGITPDNKFKPFIIHNSGYVIKVVIAVDEKISSQFQMLPCDTVSIQCAGQKYTVAAGDALACKSDRDVIIEVPTQKNGSVGIASIEFMQAK